MHSAWQNHAADTEITEAMLQLNALLLLVSHSPLPQGPAPSADPCSPDPALRAWHAEAAERARTARAEERAVEPGDDGWLFLASELGSMASPPPADWSASPVFEAVLDFHTQLASVGVRLLFVPVPAKAALEARHLGLDAPVPEGRLDPCLRQLYDALEARGVELLDLAPDFAAARGDAPLYCRTDTHWTSATSLRAARAIATRIEERGWLTQSARVDYVLGESVLELRGDLARRSGSAQSERILLATVSDPRSGAPPAPERTSPLLLLGDSHVLVFHDPALFARGAGLPDHLTQALGRPVDPIGIRGSGAGATRAAVARRRDRLAGKQVVVWVLSVRELTDPGLWRKIDVLGSAR